LNAFALTPLVLRRLKLALKTLSLAGSMGSLTSLFSDRDNSSSRVSFENEPSSISEIKFPVRSILLRVTVERQTRVNAAGAIMSVSLPTGVVSSDQ